MTDGRAAVPMMPELTELQQSSAFTAAVLSMIDGQTSIDDMAARVAPAWHTEPSAAADHLRAFFGSFFGDPGTR